MNLCKTKGILGSWKLWFSYINEKKYQNQNFGSFSADFQFRAEGKKVTSRAELKVLQLELWLEPARLGLISQLKLKYTVGKIKFTCLYKIDPYLLFCKKKIVCNSGISILKLVIVELGDIFFADVMYKNGCGQCKKWQKSSGTSHYSNICTLLLHIHQ